MAAGLYRRYRLRLGRCWAVRLAAKAGLDITNVLQSSVNIKTTSNPWRDQSIRIFGSNGNRMGTRNVYTMTSTGERAAGLDENSPPCSVYQASGDPPGRSKETPMIKRTLRSRRHDAATSDGRHCRRHHPQTAPTRRPPSDHQRVRPADRAVRRRAGSRLADGVDGRGQLPAVSAGGRSSRATVSVSTGPARSARTARCRHGASSTRSRSGSSTACGAAAANVNDDGS